MEGLGSLTAWQGRQSTTHYQYLSPAATSHSNHAKACWNSVCHLADSAQAKTITVLIQSLSISKPSDTGAVSSPVPQPTLCLSHSARETLQNFPVRIPPYTRIKHLSLSPWHLRFTQEAVTVSETKLSPGKNIREHQSRDLKRESLYNRTQEKLIKLRP